MRRPRSAPLRSPVRRSVLRLAITPSTIAASSTVRVIGPAESWLAAIGMMPPWLTTPMPGFMPTIPFFEDGLTIDPSVSVPMVIAAYPAAAATPEPELEPPGLRSSAWGLRVWRPRPLQPEHERTERALAHSLRLVFPM